MADVGDAIVVRIKPTTKYDRALIVFKGGTADAVQQRVAEWFGLDSVSVTSQTPHATFLEGESIAKATGAVKSGLGGRVINMATTQPDVPADAGRPAERHTEPPTGTDELTPEQQLILQISQVTTMKDLGALWMKNKTAWQTEAVAKAAETKSGELK